MPAVLEFGGSRGLEYTPFKAATDTQSGEFEFVLQLRAIIMAASHLIKGADRCVPVTENSLYRRFGVVISYEAGAGLQ